jgi:hypothetical protein
MPRTLVERHVVKDRQCRGFGHRGSGFRVQVQGSEEVRG